MRYLSRKMKTMIIIMILVNITIPVVPASVVPIGCVVYESVTPESVVLSSVVGAKTVTNLKVFIIIVLLKRIFQ